jgi:hypothetical protein
VDDDTGAVDFRQAHSQEWLDHFARIGHPAARPLAAGVEGAVYRLGDGTVAKVWGRRGIPELLLWQAFYADVAAGGLPFATPLILRVEEVACTGPPTRSPPATHSRQTEPTDTLPGASTN